MGVAERHRAVDFEIEGDSLAPFDVLDGDVVHRQASPRCDHQHPLEDRFVVELERIGGDGQSASGQRRAIRACSSALIAATRSSGRVRDTETMTSPTILGPLGRSRIASIPATLVRADDKGADRLGQALGRAVDQRVDRRPAQAIAGRGDESRRRRSRPARRHEDSPRASRRGLRGPAPTRRGRSNNAARRRRAHGSTSRAPHGSARASARCRRRSKTGSRRWRRRRRRPAAPPPRMRPIAWIATPIESAARKPVSASAATASILAWPNG